MTLVRCRCSLTLLAAVLLATSPLLAQPPGARRMPTYDPGTEVTLRGSVEEVVEIEKTAGGWTGLHLMLATEGETLEVHLGPKAFVEDKGLTFAAGDEIEVTGSRTMVAGEDALLARIVIRGDVTLELRDPTGRPRWSRARWHWR